MQVTRNPGNLAYHPAADIFPHMTAEDVAELAEDIREHGQREPIWVTHDWQVIDGRHRCIACAKLGIDVDCKVFDGADDAIVPFVVSLNLRRRHLSESQRAMVAARVANLTHGGDRSKASIEALKQEDAAQQLSVSRSAVQRAAKVQSTGTPSLISAVDAGTASVSAAAEVATLPVEEQEEVVARGEVTQKATEIREAKKAHVSNNSGNNEWYTPPEYIEAAREAMGGIDVDPASSDIANETVKAATYYTAETNGLDKPWPGRVWMNPPYAQPLITQFCDGLVERLERGEVEQAIVLVNNATETAFFQNMLQHANAVCFPRGRVRFLDVNGNPGGAPLQGQAVLYFAAPGEIHYITETFRTAFVKFGCVLECL